MYKRSLVNLILFTFLLCTASWFYYKKNQPVNINRLTKLNIDDINQIRIPKDNGADIVFEKTTAIDGSSNWNMLEPYKIYAHQFRINTLLSLSQTPVEKSYNITEIKLADYSLDKPRARIIFNDIEIVFGKTNPLNNKRYIMAENEITLLLDQTYPLVSAQATSFIDLSLIQDAASLSTITLPAFSINKNANKLWQVSPANALNAEQVQQLLTHWKSAQAFSVHRYLQRKQLGEIGLVIDNKLIHFIISDDDPWLILARPDLNIEYHLDSSLKARLLGHFEMATNDA